LGVEIEVTLCVSFKIAEKPTRFLEFLALLCWTLVVIFL
jgi:hypothetical protein